MPLHVQTVCLHTSISMLPLGHLVPTVWCFISWKAPENRLLLEARFLAWNSPNTICLVGSRTATISLSHYTTRNKVDIGQNALQKLLKVLPIGIVYKSLRFWPVLHCYVYSYVDYFCRFMCIKQRSKNLWVVSPLLVGFFSYPHTVRYYCGTLIFLLGGQSVSNKASLAALRLYNYFIWLTLLY